jgi:hypothetical protein
MKEGSTKRIHCSVLVAAVPFGTVLADKDQVNADLLAFVNG